MASSTFNPNWDTNWTATSIASSSINNAATSTTSAISNDNKFATEISIQCTYGAATAGITVYVLRDLDGTNYETTNDVPWQIQIPYTTSAARNRTFTVAGTHISNFKVCVSNTSGATATVTVNYKQCTIDQG